MNRPRSQRQEENIPGTSYFSLPPKNPARPSSSNRRKRNRSKSHQKKSHEQPAKYENVLMVLPGVRLDPLKTLVEVDTREELIEVQVVEIPVRLANKATSIFKPLSASNESERPLNHIRRLVSYPHLPKSFLKQNGLSVPQPATIFFVLAASATLPEESIMQVLRPHITRGPADFGQLPRLYKALIPSIPPNSSEKAKAWSERHWPCVFNPASQVMQNAPPLKMLKAILTELDTEKSDDYITLATRLAQESQKGGFGRGVGAVIVDPQHNEIVAVAGDARWWPINDATGLIKGQELGEGRPEQHALMRAISMVATKEVRRRQKAYQVYVHETGEVEYSGTRALTPTETRYFAAPDVAEDGLQPQDQLKMQTVIRPDSYLCNGLDVYLTHEPCVCCSMSMIHSRFRACVFARRVPGTGGLCAETAEGGLGYGLFWRKELNWRVMAFQYTGCIDGLPEDNGNLGSFHA